MATALQSNVIATAFQSKDMATALQKILLGKLKNLSYISWDVYSLWFDWGQYMIEVKWQHKWLCYSSLWKHSPHYLRFNKFTLFFFYMHKAAWYPTCDGE